jgi:hypothetical protein
MSSTTKARIRVAAGRMARRLLQASMCWTGI